MVLLMKIMVTSFNMSPTHTATLNVPNSAAGHRRPTPLPETPRPSGGWVSLLWGDCSFLLGPGVHRFLFVPSQSLFPKSYVSSGGSSVG